MSDEWGNGKPQQVSQYGVTPKPMWEPPASGPVGRSGEPIEVAPGTNAPATINGRPFSGHALDRVQGRGIPPSAVDDAISTGQASSGKRAETTDYYNSTNNITVTIDTLTGRVVTVRQGKP